MAQPSFKDQGNDEYKAGNWLKAAALYSKAIKEDPSNAVLYRWGGRGGRRVPPRCLSIRAAAGRHRSVANNGLVVQAGAGRAFHVQTHGRRWRCGRPRTDAGC